MSFFDPTRTLPNGKCDQRKLKGGMATFREAVFSIIAAAALLFGLGSFTAALACPSSYVEAQDKSACCPQSEDEDCGILYCTGICQTLPPAVPASGSGNALPEVYTGDPQTLSAIKSGPEPPPPRSA